MFGNHTYNKSIKSLLRSDGGKELESVFTEDLYGAQVTMGLVILGFQALMIVSSLLRGGPLNSPRQGVYFLLYVLLFTLTLAFLFTLTGLHRLCPGSASKQILLSFYYSTLLCIWSCMLTLLDQHNGTNVSVFSYVLMAMAVFSSLRPWQSIVVFGGGFFFLNLTAYFLQDNPLFFEDALNSYSLGINSFFVSILAIATSITLYRYRIMNRRSRDLIQNQYDQISAINQKLNDMAMTDQLTGIGNRRYLNDQLQLLALEQSTHPCSAAGMMLDIDYFKQYNDNFGHQAGDVCLQQLADILRHFAAAHNALLVRYGGEEFFLCLTGCTDAAAQAEALRREIIARRLERSDLPSGCVTVSIGVDVEEHWADLGQDAFLRRCDQALYEAKNSGRNRVCVYSHFPASTH